MSDKCVYPKHTNIGYVIMCLYIPDLLIFRSSKEIIKSTKGMHSVVFDMKDLGIADVILGVKIHKTDQEYVLFQSHYIEKILKILNNAI